MSNNNTFLLSSLSTNIRLPFLWTRCFCYVLLFINIQSDHVFLNSLLLIYFTIHLSRAYILWAEYPSSIICIMLNCRIMLLIVYGFSLWFLTSTNIWRSLQILLKTTSIFFLLLAQTSNLKIRPVNQIEFWFISICCLNLKWLLYLRSM